MHLQVRPDLLILTLLLVAGCTGMPGGPTVNLVESEPFAYRSVLSDADAKAYYHFTRAIMLHNQGDLDGVVAALEETLRHDRRTPGLRLYLAEVLLQLQRDEEAVRHLEDVLIDAPDSLQALRLLGEVYLEKRMYPLAMSQFSRLVELQPSDEDSILLLVQTMTKRGDAVDAIDVLKNFLSANAGSYRGYYALARLYRQIELFALAEQSYRKVITLQPRLLPVFLELGRIYEERNHPGDQERAIELYREGLKSRPEDPGLRHRLVQMLLLADNLAAARSELEILLESHPEDGEALRKYGLLQMETEQWADAAATFERLLPLTQERDTIRYYLGNVYEKIAQPYEALREFLQITPKAEYYPDALIHAAYLYRMLGEAERAYKVLMPLLDDSRLSIDHVILMSSLADESGHVNQALQIFQHGEQRFPGNTKLIFRRGILLDRIGMHEASRQAMREILDLDPYHAEALNFIAYQYAELGIELDEALKLAKRAIELNESGHIYDTLGWVYYRLGRYGEAVASLRAALSDIPDDPVIHEHLGDALSAQQQPDEARRHYRKALELDPDNSGLQEKLEGTE